MAGHSKFKNIMHRKRAVDAKRSSAFSKHARAIMTAVRTGGADPAMNLSLRYAMDRARADNMTNDAIARAIKAGSGTKEGDDYVELTYEGYGPGGVAVLVDALTDNRNRTASDVRALFDKHGGNLGESGSVAWNFDRRAVFVVRADADEEEDLLELVMEAGADDLAHDPGEGTFEITAEPSCFHAVREALEGAGRRREREEITPLAKNTVALEEPGKVRSLVKLLERLDELDDVQSTATNLEWSDEALAVLEAESG